MYQKNRPASIRGAVLLLLLSGLPAAIRPPDRKLFSGNSFIRSVQKVSTSGALVKELKVAVASFK